MANFLNSVNFLKSERTAFKMRDLFVVKNVYSNSFQKSQDDHFDYVCLCVFLVKSKS